MAGKGGVRPGAGRKSKAHKLVEAKFACTFFDEREQQRIWKSMLKSDDERIVLDTAKYLTDRLYGKAAQSVDMTTKGESIAQVIVNL